MNGQSWHSRAVADALAGLEASERGLDDSEVQQRLERYGRNRLPQVRRRNPLLRFVRHFHNILIYVLLGAAVVTALFDHLVDTFVILAVVLVNAVIGYIQEGKAEKALEAICDMLVPRASVLRDGERHSVAGEELVPGDIVLLEAGDKVPADLRLLQTKGLQLQEAILTGESLPVDKGIRAVEEAVALGDRSCMAYSGTLVTSGLGRGLVVATGADTEIGRISGLLSRVELLTTPLVRQMNVFARWLTVVILSLAVLLFGFGLFVGHYPVAEIFRAVVGVSVAAIPEGLPAVLTITLAIGVQAMARRNAIVRRLPAIETLGSVSVICTDKTGTLTRNEMTVASVITADEIFEVNGAGYSPTGEVILRGEITRPGEHAPLAELARAAALCNDAALREQEGDWRVEGDPMEGALLAFAGCAGVDVQSLGSRWARTDAIPFAAEHRFMATLNHDHEQHAFIFVKGAPERILGMCREQLVAEGESAPLDEPHWRRTAEEIAARGQRLLAFAARAVRPQHTVLEHADIEGSLTLLGMVGLLDPPRDEAISAVAECHTAGIRVKMITGDHAGTAAAIGRQVGLRNTESVLTGGDLDGMDEAALAHAVEGTDVFARTSPEHKLRLVMALQARGETLAMTGDGVNDAPALKRADAGIAMGLKGSEVAKEASELVLADDNFASIAAAVREGRTVYDNLMKVISFLLPVNGGESLSLIIAILLGLTLPITPAQILWVNMASSVALAMALAFEAPEAEVMRRPPRRVDAPMLSRLLIWRVLFVSLLFTAGVFGQFLLASWQGEGLQTVRTMTVNTLVVMEIFYLFSVRYLYGTSLTWRGAMGTPAVLTAVAVVAVLQLLFTYAPFMHRYFETASLGIRQGMQVLAFGVGILLLLELEKLVLRRLRARRTPALVAEVG